LPKGLAIRLEGNVYPGGPVRRLCGAKLLFIENQDHAKIFSGFHAQVFPKMAFLLAVLAFETGVAPLKSFFASIIRP